MKQAPLIADDEPGSRGFGFFRRLALQTGTVGLIAVCGAAFAGCKGFSFGSDRPLLEAKLVAPLLPRELAPLRDFLSIAGEGETLRLEDPRTGSRVRVRAGRRYAAASGRSCRRFSAAPSPGYAGLSVGLACQDASGRWRISRLIVNADDLAGPGEAAGQ